jgi:hypothetical protein
LDENTTLDNFLKIFDNNNNYKIDYYTNNNKQEKINLNLQLLLINDSTYLSKEIWKINFGKCIDGTPVYSNGYVYVRVAVPEKRNSTIFIYIQNKKFRYLLIF